MTPKQRAAQAALKYVKSGMAVGLGTGSTADFLPDRAGAGDQGGGFARYQGSPHIPAIGTPGDRTGHSAVQPGRNAPICDMTVDGADEVAPNLDLIKGLGGALLREKIVAQNSKRLVIIADEGKVVAKLGTKSPLPVEVAQFGYETQERFLRSMGAEPKLRVGPGGMVFVTDNGNCIYDCHFKDGISNPAAIESALRTGGDCGERVVSGDCFDCADWE